MQEIPENKTWASLADVSSDWPEINLNLSETAGSERNTFYIIQEADETTELELGLSQLRAYTITDSSGIGGGFRVEKALDADDVLEIGTPIDVTIGGEAYKAVPVHLDHFLGHSDLYITAENGGDSLRARIYFGLEVYFEGKLDGIKTVGPVWNDTNKLFGYEPEFPDFEIVTHEDGSISAYFEDACAIITDVGQGSVCTVSITLKDGYVITDIHDGEDPFVFLADDSSLYNMWDADGNLLDSQEALDAVGWDGPRSGSSTQPDGTHKVAPGTIHRIAAYGMGGVGYENVTYLKEFLDDNGFTAEKLGDFTDYNMYFDKAQYEGTDPDETIKIVFEVTRPEDFRNKPKPFWIFGRNDIELDVKPLDEEDYEKERYNGNVKQLHGDDREVKKIYNITETTDVKVAGNGFICITISADELDGGDLADYTVVYFTEDGVPVEVETTYVEGQGLVFTTGHFSTYAVIGKASTEPGGGEEGEGGGDEGGSGGNSGDNSGNEGGGSEGGSGTGGSISGGGSSAPVTPPAADPETPAESEDGDSSQMIADVENTRFAARSQLTTLNGKKAVKVTWNVPEGMELDGFDVYRSVKRYEGYGRKPFWTTTKTSYINNRDLEVGRTYYYKVRGFKYVDGEKVYTQWSYKAWRTIK